VWLVLGLALAGCDEVPPRVEISFTPSPREPLTPPTTGSPRVEPRPEGRFAVDREVFPAEERASIESLALGDCDGDGLLDAVTLGARARLRVYAGRGGGRFEALPGEVSGGPARAGTFADLDRDGVDDLVLADGAVRVLRGLGGCRFDAPRELAPVRPGDAVQVAVADVNLDGLADLSVTLQHVLRAPHRLLVARGDGGFDEFNPTPKPFAPERRPQPEFEGFGMCYVDVDDDGAQDLFAMVDQSQSWFSWGERAGELGQTRDEAVTPVFARGDPMAVSPLDFDRDGRLDWFITGTFNRSVLFWHRGGRAIFDVAEGAGVGGVGDDFAWGSYSFDADLDGWPDLLVSRVGPTTPPPQRPVLGPLDVFLNRHDGTFAEVGDAVLGLRLRARPLLCGPASPRGEVACFAMDLDGPVLLRDELRARGRQAVVRLRGTVSSPDAAGARVSVEGASPPQVWAAGAQCPFGGEHARHFQLPLGDAASARVTVTWPSGVVQRGVEVRADAITVVTEPEAVTLSARVLPADGRATAEVVVDPRAVGASRVALSLEGPARWAGEATTDDAGRVRRALVAPTERGEARVTVTLDGVALRARPRVLFDRPR